ncbi:hypothetical protein FOS14_05495 [Skermania sp. ID1734]|uniref:hypothetical protein n=1 Tax=Skermania sp. ID1734 TaxID=2597516 RepID=UPI001180F05F|nr:hypothetical protein [Skermania sp. ID1734]TSE01192.1 hypothetical protein FOS14_05495 [Skermania sp. ID1734]
MRITVIVDCNECVVRGRACRDCVITVLLGEPDPAELGCAHTSGAGARVRFDQEERAAIEALAEAGLVPHLRLVRSRVPTPGSTVIDESTSCDPRRIG